MFSDPIEPDEHLADIQQRAVELSHVVLNGAGLGVDGRMRGRAKNTASTGMVDREMESYRVMDEKDPQAVKGIPNR